MKKEAIYFKDIKSKPLKFIIAIGSGLLVLLAVLSSFLLCFPAMGIAIVLTIIIAIVPLVAMIILFPIAIIVNALKKKKVKLIIGISILVLVAFLTYWLGYKLTPCPDVIILHSVTVTDKDIRISGCQHGGLFNYLGYKTKYVDGALYIKFKGGWELPWMKGTNSPDFYPVENKYDNIDKIYLWGDWNDEDRLIWTKEDGEIINNFAK